MNDAVLAWLLDPSDPSVRYRTLTELLGQPADDPEVLKARQSIMQTNPVRQILDQQNDDGSWGDPFRYYTDKYTGSVWTLLLLAELSADPADLQVVRACQFILRKVQNPETGGFSCQASKINGQGLASGLIPCLTGNMLYSLIRLGHLHDPEVQRAVQWIVDIHRADDGDEPVPPGPPYNRYIMCWGRHSCHMGVAKSLKGLAAIPPELRSAEVQNKIRLFGEYFLRHHLYKKSHNLSEVSKPGWLKPGFPLMYQTDILELLELFADLNWWDDRLADALQIIRNKEQETGQWLMENSFNGKMSVRIEQKGKPSKWMTFKAIKVINQLDLARQNACVSV